MLAQVFVRRCALYATARTLSALSVASVQAALYGHDLPLARGLEWIQEGVQHMHMEDADDECRNLAFACYQLGADIVQRAQAEQPADVMGQLLIDIKQASVYSL